MNPNDNLQRLSEAVAALEGATARGRLTALVDEGSFVELDALYGAGVVTGYGAIDGQPVFVFAQDSAALGAAQAARIRKVYGLAVKTGAPVIGLYDSNGAKLTEGYEMLTAYGDLLLCVNNLSGVVPQIAVVTGACGGTSALLAAAADFVIMAADAELFVAPPSVSGGSGTAQAAAEAGVCHIVAADADAAIARARALAGLLPANNLAAPPLFEGDAPAGDSACPIERVADAGSLLALGEAYAPHASTSLGTLGGVPVGFAGIHGALCADACKKLARFVRFCDAFGLPLVTAVDTEGFAETADAEDIRAYAQLGHVYAEATCQKLAVIAGKAYGAAYIALAGKAANADLVFALPDAVISPLAPETAVSILYNDRITQQTSREQLAAAYEAGEASAFAAAKAGVVDAVVAPTDLRDALISSLDVLAGKRESRLPKKHSVSPL